MSGRWGGVLISYIKMVMAVVVPVTEENQHTASKQNLAEGCPSSLAFCFVGKEASSTDRCRNLTFID